MSKKKKAAELTALIGNRLKFYRLQNGLTQREVADSVQIDRSTYTKYETGVAAPSNEVMIRIVKLFGIDFNAMLDPNEKEADINIDVDELQASDSVDTDLAGKGVAGLKEDERNIVICYRVMSTENKEKLADIINKILTEQISG